jgi:flagellar hook-associated protein 3 FlgL
VLGIANQRIAGRYLFSGTLTDTPPFDSAGAYQGNGSLIEIPLDEGRVAINMAGNIAFGAVGSGGALDILDRFETALMNNDTVAIRGIIEEIDAEIEANGVRIASFGARQARVDAAELRIVDTRLELARRLDELGAADLAEVISDVQRLEAGYQATLQAGTRLYGPTFFDFLG